MSGTRIARLPTVALVLALVAGLLTGPPALADAATDVRAVLDAQIAAWNRGDMEAFLSAYHQSPELTFFSGGSVTRGFEPFAERFRARYGAEGRGMDPLSFDQVEVEVLAEGVALVRGHWRLDPAEGEAVGGLFTLVVRRLPEAGWRITHDHTSVPSPP